MATLNLGRIKPVFRGAYAGGTAYVVDDIVTSGNETFICIQASTGNATSNASYWTKLAAKGTDGTDVGTTLTTQGDILYRDGSGLQRLAKPASNKFLQNTSGGNLSWETVSGGVLQVKQMTTDTTYSVNRDDWNDFNSAFKLNFTPTASDSRYLLECYLSLGMESHDGMYTMNWWDSQKGTSSSDTIVPVSSYSSSRTQGSLALFPAGAAVSGGWDDYWLSGHYVSYLYYPDSSERNTNARDFIPVIKRCAGHSFTIRLNIPHNNSNLNKSAISWIRVTELAGGIIS